MGSTEVLSPEERVERVRMALAEAGYPGALVRWAGDAHGVAISYSTEIPKEVRFRARAIAGTVRACWPCYVGGTGRSCTHDPLTSPWPPIPSLLSADQETKP